MSDADLATWLRSQLDDDERVARQAVADNDGDGRWPIEDSSPYPRLLWLDVMHSTCPETIPPGMAEHISRWDPARVLAEIDAKRRILDLAPAGVMHALGTQDPDFRDGYVAAHEDMVKLLALPYAGREGYSEEWLPT